MRFRPVLDCQDGARRLHPGQYIDTVALILLTGVAVRRSNVASQSATPFSLEGRKLLAVQCRATSLETHLAAYGAARSCGPYARQGDVMKRRCLRCEPRRSPCARQGKVLELYRVNVIGARLI